MKSLTAVTYMMYLIVTYFLYFFNGRHLRRVELLVQEILRTTQIVLDQLAQAAA